MNVSVFYSSLRYLNDNFDKVSKLSLFTFESLVKINKDSSKVTKAIEKNHVDVLKILVEEDTNFEDKITMIIDDIQNYKNTLTINAGCIKLINDYIEKHNYKSICALLLTNETQKYINDRHYYYFCLHNFSDCHKILNDKGYKSLDNTYIKISYTTQTNSHFSGFVTSNDKSAVINFLLSEGVKIRNIGFHKTT